MIVYMQVVCVTVSVCLYLGVCNRTYTNAEVLW